MIKVIRNNDIDQITLDEIFNIKKLSWEYSKQEHLNWITENLNGNDYHFLLINNNEIIAYLNLVNVNVIYKNTSIPFIGIGNVCSKYKGVGLGKEIISEVNKFIKANYLYGILFCKHQLIDFYSKSNWLMIENIDISKNVYTMVYNFNLDPTSLKYNDRLF